LELVAYLNFRRSRGAYRGSLLIPAHGVFPWAGIFLSSANACRDRTRIIIIIIIVVRGA
jgi:hypothetical protein